MENKLKIESLQNPRVKMAVKLRKDKVRKEARQTLVEGYREILRAVENGWRFIELYTCPELYLDDGVDELIDDLQKIGTPIYTCTETAFRKMSYRDTPDGLLALSPLVEKTLDELVLPDAPLLVIAEGLEKPGNLGTILRSADGAGADAVIVCGNKTDINNPNVIRASIGSLFFMPVAQASTRETITWLRKQGIRSLAALPGAQNDYTDTNMRDGIAIVVGAEDAGLTNEWITNADLQVRIPMLGNNDSLNVSTASAILLYEALRQRRTS
jgi:TrmH family RNA methyltransferase